MVEQVIARAKTDPAPEPDDAGRLYVPTGSALLNLALSDKADGGFLTGKIANVVGDQSSGKTFLCLTTLATAAHDKRFDDYLLVYDDAEAACEFDFAKLFGQRAAGRILPPSLDRDDPGDSHTIQEFQTNLRRLLRGDKPFIYVQDSFDALSSDEEMNRANEVDKACAAGKEIKGTYGMDKAKHASVLLRLLAAELKRTQSLLLIISQTRDNIDPLSFQSKTRAGGRALYFYCSYEMWMAVRSKVITKVHDRPHTVGVNSRIKITKNKATGKLHELDLPFLYHYGADDIGACVDFLVAEKAWPKGESGLISAPGVAAKPMYRSMLIHLIEERDLADKVSKVAERVWLEIEKELRPARKPKYREED